MSNEEQQSSWGLLTHIKMIGLRPALQAVRYQLRRQLKDVQFRQYIRPEPSGSWQGLGALQGYEQDAQGVLFQAESGCLRLDVISKECLRISVLPEGQRNDPFSYAVIRQDWEPVSFGLEDQDDAVVIQVDSTICRVERASLKLTVASVDGQVIYQDAEGPAWRGQAVRLSARMTPHESGHGLGERASDFNLRGRIYQLWNTDPAGYARGDDPINLSIPFYVGLRGLHAYGLFWDNSARGTVSVGAAGNPDQLIFEGEDGALRYYLFTGPTALQVVRQYTALTGRMAMPPLWALGYHQCRWSYMSADEALEIGRQFRKRQIPCDAIYLDIDYMDGFRCFTWNQAQFPDPANLIKMLAGDGFRTVVMIDPGIKVDPDYHVYRSGLEHDVFLKYPDGSRFVAPVWPGDCCFPDFSSPRVRDWWGKLYASLLDLGVAGVWNDMNEPAIFSSSLAYKDMPDYLQHDTEGLGAPHIVAHNTYGMQMVRATREGLEALQPERRHLVITRAGFAGVQRYASSWTADNLSTWDHLLLSISMCLNLGLSGLAFTGPDIGGFAYNASGEMFARWLQLAVLLPFFRGHSAKGTIQQEPWAFGQPYEDVNRRYIELRYRLLPYIYSTFADCAAQGFPIVRSLALLDNGFADCVDQYMHGDALMVAPVVKAGATSREVRFPSGVWYDYWTGQRIEGGDTQTVDAPLEVLPLYVRAGHVVPHWPVVQHTSQVQGAELELRIYAGNGVSRFYEDAGEGKAYLHGEHRWSTFEMNEDAHQLRVTWVREGQYQPAYQQVQLRITGVEAGPQAVELDGQPVEWTMEEGQIVISVPVFSVLVIRR